MFLEDCLAGCRSEADSSTHKEDLSPIYIRNSQRGRGFLRHFGTAAAGFLRIARLCLVLGIPSDEVAQDPPLGLPQSLSMASQNLQTRNEAQTWDWSYICICIYIHTHLIHTL